MQGFIFELTDLYEKKNIPKVIYCIHALRYVMDIRSSLLAAYADLSSHLLAHRGMAQRIGNLIGHLHFSDDQLQKTQKGLTESGVTMPNFGNVGRELAKEIYEEPEVEIETEEEREDILFDQHASVVLR
jgi:Ras GTPase-activating-like protein IQGAP2/3